MLYVLKSGRSSIKYANEDIGMNCIEAGWLISHLKQLFIYSNQPGNFNLKCNLQKQDWLIVAHLRRRRIFIISSKSQGSSQSNFKNKNSFAQACEYPPR